VSHIRCRSQCAACVGLILDRAGGAWLEARIEIAGLGDQQCFERQVRDIVLVTTAAPSSSIRLQQSARSGLVPRNAVDEQWTFPLNTFSPQELEALFGR
jgi:hypothetical protein